MKKILLIVAGFILAIGTTVWALPYRGSVQELAPFVDDTYHLGSTTGNNLRFKAANLGTGTSTAANGWNITSGCFAVNGVCAGAGQIGSGTQGQFPFYNAAGTTLTATSTLFISQAGGIGISTTTIPSGFSFVQAGGRAKLQPQDSSLNFNDVYFSTKHYRHVPNGAGLFVTDPGGSLSDSSVIKVSSGRIGFGTGSLSSGLTDAKMEFRGSALLVSALTSGAAFQLAENDAGDSNYLTMYHDSASGYNDTFYMLTAQVASSTSRPELQIGGRNIKFLTGTNGQSAGTEQAVITSAGLFGISTTSPTLPLSVTYGTGNSAYFAGNVGVGMNSPTAKLYLFSSTTESQPSLYIKPGSSSNPNAITVERRDNTSTVFSVDGTGIAFMNLLGVGEAEDATNQGRFTIGTPARVGLLIKGANSQSADYFKVTNDISTVQFNVDSAGDVGVATSSPWGKLSVTNSGTGPSFVVEDTTSPDSTPFLIGANGDVGIGISSPTQKLDVLGFINTDALSGYKQAGNTILYASSTNFSTLGGISAGAGLIGDGIDNTSFGYQALQTATSTDDNTAFGYQALKSSTQGASSNTALGSQAGATLTTGNQNVFIGHEAGRFATVAAQNVVIGMNAVGDATFTGSSNTVIGFNSGTVITSANSNTLIGANLANSLTTGASNVAIGATVLGALTTGSLNIGIGSIVLSAVTTGTNNIAIGGTVATALTTGANNMTIGGQGMSSLTTGSENVGMGYGNLAGNTTGNDNVGIGNYAGHYVKPGSQNTFVGKDAGFGVDTVSTFTGSTMLGYRAGYAITTGGNNLLLGRQAGDNLTSGAKNIIVGTDIDAPSATDSNQLNIGNIIFGTGVSGTGTTLAGSIGISTTTPGTLLSVQGIANFHTATSTFQSTGGINLLNGCFAIAGTCVGGSGSGTVGSGTQGQTVFYNSAGTTLTATSTITLTQAGRVGIGTTTPSTVLHTFGNASGLTIQQSISGSTFNGIDFMAYDGGVDASIKLNQSTGEIRYDAISSYFPTFYAGGAERMRISTAGNMGIGTTSPYAKLSVVGETVASFFTATTTTATSTFAGGVGIGTTTPSTKVEINNSLAFTSEHNQTSSGNAVTVDWTTGNYQKIDQITENTTVTFVAPNSKKAVGQLQLRFVNDGVGGYTVTWPASVKWLPAGTAPTFTTTASTRSVVEMFTIDGGTTWFAGLAGTGIA